MNDPADAAESRPWYREPWPWVLIALPFLTIIASAVTLWLAISHPDFLVVETAEYQQVKAGLRAEPTPDTAAAPEKTDGER